MRCAAAPTVILAALALAGCAGGSGGEDSSGKFEGEQKLVANTVEDLETAADDRDGAKVCRDLIAAELQQRISRSAQGTACSRAVDDAIEDADATDLEVRSVVVRGTSATAVVRADLGDDRSEDRTMSLVKQGGRWKISDLGS